MIDPILRAGHDQFGNCEELLSAKHKAVIDAGNIRRVGGAILCIKCNREYYSHPSVLGALWATEICSGELVKL